MRHFNKLIQTIFQNEKIQFSHPKNIRKMTSIKDSLIFNVTDELPTSGNKVTVYGIGHVGMACALSILTQNVSNDICLLGRSKDKLMGEMIDLQHGSSFLNNPKVIASTDYAESSGSRVCIFAAGVTTKKGESRLSLVQRNADILKQVIPKLIANSPDTVLIVITNPVDAMTYVAWKVSGLPKHRVIGSGTSLDSTRFRFFISQRLNVAPTSCHGWIIGEHGDSCVPVWSGVNIAGVRLRDLNPKIGTSDGPEKWNEINKQVVKGGYSVFKLKGYTNWAIALCVARITSAILKNDNSVIAVSTSVVGEHCIDKDVFVSLPCVLNSCGVRSIVRQVLDPTEVEQFQNSANLMAKVQDRIKF